MLIGFVSVCVKQDWACAAETFMTDTVSIFVFSVDNAAVASSACCSAEENTWFLLRLSDVNRVRAEGGHLSIPRLREKLLLGAGHCWLWLGTFTGSSSGCCIIEVPVVRWRLLPFCAFQLARVAEDPLLATMRALFFPFAWLSLRPN